MSRSVAKLNGYRVYYRPGTADEGTLEDIGRGYHLPPDVVRKPERIVDLGAHAGYAAVDLLTKFPMARVYSIEPDMDNYLLMMDNTARWQTRHVGLHLAVSDYSGTGTIVGFANNSGVLRGGDEVQVMELSRLFDVFGLGWADYVKMDIEGEERAVLSSQGWAERTGCVKVELHDGIEVEDAIAILQEQGFERCERDGDHPKCVWGWRPRPS